MGGDRAPREVVLGAIQVAHADPDLRLQLVGRQDSVQRELDEGDWRGENIEIVHAEQTIEMGDSPIEALKRKRGSSIEVATLLVRDGRADAMVSAGNTGACVASGALRLGLLPEVRRPGIGVTFYPGPHPVVLIDAGANPSSKPEHLIQYGIMANLYARKVLRVENPRVALLNIGGEDAKGNSLAKTTHNLFQQTSLNYIGNVEGGDVFSGGCDVVVCDGFVGNIVLKVSEGLAERLVELFRGGVEQFVATLRERLRTVADGLSEEGGGPGLEMLFKETFRSLRERIDYSETGGAQLLGVNGVMIIAHGRSDAKAIANAIRTAQRMAETGVNESITEGIRAFSGQKEPT